MTDYIESHVVPRELWVEGPFKVLLSRISEKMGSESPYYDQEFSNDFFTIRPYYWGEDEDEICKPNFEIPSENFELDWYKYPFRNSYSNEKLTPSRWNDLIQKCIASLNHISQLLS